MTATYILLCLSILVGRASSMTGDLLTPSIFLKENADIFAVVNAATARVVAAGGLLADILANPHVETNATVFLALDAGFVQASNRSVESMVKEVNESSIKPLESWLRQWITTQSLPTPDSLLEAQKVISLSGEALTFKLEGGGSTIILRADNMEQGAGEILGPAAIPMGQVTTYIVAPIEGGDLYG